MSSSVSKPKAPPKPCIRSYLFKVDSRCNGSKLKALDAMHAEWKCLLPVVGDHLWQKFLAGEPVSRSLSSTVGELSVFGTTPLVTSVKQCLAVAVEGQLKSWKSNLKRRIARLVTGTQAPQSPVEALYPKTCRTKENGRISDRSLFCVLEFGVRLSRELPTYNPSAYKLA